MGWVTKAASTGSTWNPEESSYRQTLKSRSPYLGEEYLYAEHGSWEDGDGELGTIVIDPGTGKIVNKYGWYFTDVDYETKEF